MDAPIIFKVQVEKNVRVKRSIVITILYWLFNCNFSELSVNVWYHLAFTWHRQSRRHKLYINGALDSEEESGQSKLNLKSTKEPDFLIGKRDGNSPRSDYWISDWAVLSQALSEDEISLLKGTEDSICSNI